VHLRIYYISLRQGPLLSPYLFIICAEGLSSLIRDVEDMWVISGTQVCRGEPLVFHLLFANDWFISFKSEESQVQVMKIILSVYEATSGQAISLPKLEIFCSRNVCESIKHDITNILGVQFVLVTGKYLGLPSMIRRDKTTTFAFIKDQVWHKFNYWNSKCMSKALRSHD